MDRPSEIADQLRERIVSALHLGTLREGTRLPGSRQLARELGATPRTVVAAYRLLEGEGLVELRERSGAYVAAVHPHEGAMLTQLSGWLVSVLLEGRARGVAPVELADRVRRCLETLRLRVLCVAGNEDQLEHLCHEARADYGMSTDGVLAERLEPLDEETSWRVRRADLLLTTSLCATLSQRIGAIFRTPVFVVSLRDDLMRDLRAALERGPTWFIGTDPRFRGDLRALFGAAGLGENVRTLIVGEDDPDTLPADAPAWMMRTAHRALGDHPLARRLTPSPRVFSRRLAEDLLTFVVRANMIAMDRRSA